MYIITLIIADTQKAYDEKKISRQILQLNHVHFMQNIFESQTSVLFRFLIAIRLYKIEV